MLVQIPAGEIKVQGSNGSRFIAIVRASDAAPVLADLATHAGVRYLHRPANLEDLFIKLTGRELRD